MARSEKKFSSPLSVADVQLLTIPRAYFERRPVSKSKYKNLMSLVNSGIIPKYEVEDPCSQHSKRPITFKREKSVQVCYLLPLKESTSFSEPFICRKKITQFYPPLFPLLQRTALSPRPSMCRKMENRSLNFCSPFLLQ